MEHRLILGGEQYLPFARSCVAKLKKLGLPYADQSYAVDGVSIKVRIEPGHEYIRIEGGESALYMDSGIVSYSNPYSESGSQYGPGTLYETGRVARYNLAFSEEKADWKANPEKTSNGQISGDIHKTNVFKGRVPFDARDAKSFRSGYIADGATPPGWVLNLSDDTLVLKKIVARICPASVFTGRCRLYVQAIYGQHLYTDVLSKTGTPSAASEAADGRFVPSLGPYIGNNIAPALRLNAYRRKGDTAEYPLVDLTTNSGVHLDKATGRHWLFNPHMGDTPAPLVAYPLIALPKAEALRYLLAEGGAGKMTPDDIEHLEAYILSTCLPDVKNAQSVGAMTTPEGWYMGYGWHWNWDGLVSDIVGNAQFVQPTPSGIYAYAAMRSTHARITMSRTLSEKREATWSCTPTTVESEKQWAIDRTRWSITEPDWSRGVLNRTTPKFTTMFACDAPFYAFYIRNDLHVCRVEVTTVPAIDGARSITPGFGDQAYGGYVSQATTGDMDGFREDKDAVAEHLSVSLSCGSYTVSGLSETIARGGHYDYVGDKVFLGEYSTGFTPGSLGWVTLEYGYPPYSTTPPTWGRAQTGSLGKYQWSYIASVTSDTTISTAIVVVPFFDSEAVYMDTTLVQVEYRSGRKLTREAFIGFSERVRLLTQDYATGVAGPTLEYIKFYNISAGATLPDGVVSTVVADDPDYNEEYEVQADQKTKLISHAGVTDAVFTNWEQFHAGDVEEIGAMFTTFSGTSDTTPVVITPNNGEHIGTGSAPVGNNTLIHAIVGWA